LRAKGDYSLLWLVALALFGSLISFYYYLMVLKAIFVDKGPVLSEQPRSDLLQRLAIGVLAGIVLFLGLFPGGLVWKISSSLPSPNWSSQRD
jgi:NADH:ubiquinone oxidoreductase subunit 2 (subunit N)